MPRESRGHLRDKERRAVEMHLGGATYEQIAHQLGYSNASGPQKAVMRCLERDIQKDLEPVRTTSIARIDRLIMAAWPKASRGDIPAILAIEKLEARRAKYIAGLEAPAQLEVKTETVTRDDLKTYLAGAAEAFAAQREVKTDVL